MQKNIILKEEQLKSATSFEDIWRQLELDKFEYKLVKEFEGVDPNNKEQTKYGITRSDLTNNIRLYKNSSVRKNYNILNTKDILNIGNKLFTNNSNLQIVQAFSNNYAERVVFKMILKDYVNPYKDLPGIGQTQPNFYLEFPVKGKIQLLMTMFQINCTNQVPAIANSAINNLLLVEKNKDVKTQIDNVTFNFQKFEQQFNNTLQTLHSWSEKEITDKEFYLFCSRVFDKTYETDFEKERKDIWLMLHNSYTQAPNALPGTLLGAYNSITHYNVIKPYKRRNPALSQLSRSPEYQLNKKAQELLMSINKYGNSVLFP